MSDFTGERFIPVKLDSNDISHLQIHLGLYPILGTSGYYPSNGLCRSGADDPVDQPTDSEYPRYQVVITLPARVLSMIGFLQYTVGTPCCHHRR